MKNKEYCNRCSIKTKLNNYGWCSDCDKKIPSKKSSIFSSFEEEKKALNILKRKICN